MTTTTTVKRSQSRTIPAQPPELPSSRGGTPSALDSASVAAILAALSSLSTWPEGRTSARRLILTTDRMLEWLQPLAEEGWQARWQRAEELYGARWHAWPVAAASGAVGGRSDYRKELTRGLGCLIKLRLVKPSYAFLTTYGPTRLFDHMRAEVSPDLFARAEQAARARGMNEQQVRLALNMLTAMVIHLCGGLRDITAEDMLEFQSAVKRPRARSAEGAHAAWQMLVDLDVLPPRTSLRTALRAGQLPTAQLVYYYQISNEKIRGLLVRYLDELRPGLDYSTFMGLVSRLVGQFWADIECHHPGIATINLPDDVAQAWKDRVRAPRRGRETKRHWDIFIAVRAFYQDIAEWAFPSPVRKHDTEGAAKQTRATVAAMHQRTRERLPNLPRLVDTAEQWKNDCTAFLEAASRTAIGATVEHAGVKYRRVGPGERSRAGNQRPSHVVVENLADASLTNVTIDEDEAFWAWAVIETLRHTGILIEELLELTQLAIVSHRLADTGELVPLLQIVPSKTNEERLLLVTPELASVLAAIISRIRNPDGAVPLVARYDSHERVTGPELPHLFQHRDGFQHRNGWQTDVLHDKLVRDLLTRALVRAGITDAAGRPLRYTPHDFRRMFATEAVTGALPVHIAARILGHASINTTQSYTAVFQDDIIRSYRTFVERRRALRPSEEYREPTDSEWAEFQQHFHLRKVALGDCGRPYGTPCAHEHACVRCPMLRVDPRQRQRLIEIIRNLAERIGEAKDNGWHGESRRTDHQPQRGGEETRRARQSRPQPSGTHAPWATRHEELAPMPSLRRRTAGLIEQAGYSADQPIVIGVQQRGRPPVFLAYGSTSTGKPLTAATPVYVASLAKQITAACAALLVSEGRLDMESTLAGWMPELPNWAHAIRLRHLVHHTAGLPADNHVDALTHTDHDRTTAGIVGALARSADIPGTPGGQYLYSNAGYVCLAVVVERAADQPLPDFARRHLFTPLRMSGSRYWPGPAPHPPGAAPLPDPSPAPLSLGDGGLWATAQDLIRWNQALDVDELHISALLHTPGTLNDGTTLDYAWGLGIRTHAGRLIYRHGGGWPGLRAQLIHIPDQRSSLAVLALADDTDRTTELANALLDELNPVDPPTEMRRG